MKNAQNESYKSSGSNNKHSKSSKKSKIAKKTYENETHNSSDSENTIEESDKDVEGHTPIPGKANVKAQSLEKRKQDGNEWKGLKKTDCQRLETVLEEGQLSSEETFPKYSHDDRKSDCEIVPEPAITDKSNVKSKKSWLCNFSSASEILERVRADENPKQKKQKQQQITKKQINSEKDEKLAFEEAHGEPATPTITKEFDQEFLPATRSVIFNGMMEILPIFSNDQFVCSRDTLSVEESEDIETLDKNSSSIGRAFFEGKNLKEPYSSIISVKKDFYNDQLMEKVGDSRETERRLRYKLLTDRNVAEKTSSHFINSLLILPSFSEEKKALADVHLRDEIPERIEIIRHGLEGAACFVLCHL